MGPLSRLRNIPSTAAYAALVVVWNGLRFTPLGSLAPFGLADLFGWLLFLPLPVLVVAAVVRRLPRAAVAAALPLLVFSAEYGPLFFPQRTPPRVSPLRVLAINQYFGNPDTTGVLRLLRSAQADVVAIQELSHVSARAIPERLSKLYPHQSLHPDDGAFGFGLLSRIPFDEPRPPQRDFGTCFCQEVTLHDARRTRVVNVHTFPPGASLTGLRTEHQEQTMAILRRKAAQARGPTVMLGDFNFSDRHRFYRGMRRSLGDSHRDAGWGFGFTWMAPVPVVRIDYVFHSRHFTTRRFQTRSTHGSDHRHVWAELVSRS
ncbi:MAG TPA: endonuclease/exonuclease/phosphatase family protein [Actinomycetota bacterium]|nr:endonuclease/exonuclease/phosphatase family protein [Actinomycetota bacterium]